MKVGTPPNFKDLGNALGGNINNGVRDRFKKKFYGGGAICPKSQKLARNLKTQRREEDLQISLRKRGAMGVENGRIGIPSRLTRSVRVLHGTEAFAWGSVLWYLTEGESPELLHSNGGGKIPRKMLPQGVLTRGAWLGGNQGKGFNEGRKGKKLRKQYRHLSERGGKRIGRMNMEKAAR